MFIGQVPCQRRLLPLAWLPPCVTSSESLVETGSPSAVRRFLPVRKAASPIWNPLLEQRRSATQPEPSHRGCRKLESAACFSTAQPREAAEQLRNSSIVTVIVRRVSMVTLPCIRFPSLAQTCPESRQSSKPIVTEYSVSEAANSLKASPSGGL